MSCKFRVIVMESERGWGQKRFYQDFDTVEEAAKYRDNINAQNKPGPAPDWYMVAENNILVVEEKDETT